MCCSDPPAPPDPKKTAEAQTGQSVATAIANTMMGQVNQVGPDGKLTYGQTGSYQFNGPGGSYTIPTFTATTELTPGGQAISDANQGARLNLANIGREQSGRLGELLNRPVDTEGVTAAADRTTSRVPGYGAGPNAPGYDELSGDANLTDSYQTDFTADRQRVEDALYARINPQLEHQRENIKRELAGRGVMPGTPGYDRAMQEYGKTANDARFGAVLASGQEHQRLSDEARNAAGFTNQARQQTYGNSVAQSLANNELRSRGFSDQLTLAGRDDQNANNTFAMRTSELDAQDRSRASQLNERFNIRNQPLQELLAIMNGTALQNPNFALATPDKIANTDIAGITQQGYQNQMAAYQQQQQMKMAMMGGLFDLGGAFLGRPPGV